MRYALVTSVVIDSSQPIVHAKIEHLGEIVHVLHFDGAQVERRLVQCVLDLVAKRFRGARLRAKPDEHVGSLWLTGACTASSSAGAFASPSS